jgi:hypothetical protein
LMRKNLASYTLCVPLPHQDKLRSIVRALKIERQVH